MALFIGDGVTEEELKCCCLEKEDTKQNKDHIEKCVQQLRKKADYIESKIKN